VNGRGYDLQDLNQVILGSIEGEEGRYDTVTLHHQVRQSDVEHELELTWNSTSQNFNRNWVDLDERCIELPIRRWVEW
jgi:hypothetical protein